MVYGRKRSLASRIEVKKLNVYEQPAWIGTTNSLTWPTASFTPSVQHPWGRWLGLFYNPAHSGSDELAYSNDAAGWYDSDEKAHTAFVMSPFHLGGYPDQAGASFPIEGIPPALHNGTAQGKRIGSDVNVVSDHWSFKITCPAWYHPRQNDTSSVSGKNWEKPNTSKHFPNVRSSQRPIKIRLIGVMQHTLDRAGDIGFKPSELFKDQDRIDTHFQTDNAQGYRVIYDKTKSMALTPFNPTGTTFGTITDQTSVDNGAVISDTGVSMRQFECNFGWRGRYVLSYADTTNSGLQTPQDFPNDNETVAPQIGVTKNMVTWYIFCEDRFCYSLVANPEGTGKTDYHPVAGLKMLVTRKFKYTDN